ncbi:hypothetical protein GCM10022403_006660 [Streptomyces coacervatus]|uniref:WD40 repeat domain-containing protein n=2 Tax=Streptomyces coacervatus TaxID=647381 RepID=A0ABP7GZH3_9ACTN
MVRRLAARTSPAHLLSAVGHEEPPVQINVGAFSPDGTRLAVGDAMGRVTLWGGQSHTRLGVLDGSLSGAGADTTGPVSALAFSHDGRTLTVAASAGSVQLWDVAPTCERIRWAAVVDRARKIIEGYAPLKVTLRQVMYRLANEGVLPHTPPMPAACPRSWPASRRVHSLAVFLVRAHHRPAIVEETGLGMCPCICSRKPPVEGERARPRLGCKRAHA